VGSSHYRADRQETDEQKAERIMSQELRRFGREKEDLQRRGKGDNEKAAVARRLRKETTMSLEWTAQPRKRSVRMGSSQYVSNLLNERKRN
jgi:hypothetical protein